METLTITMRAAMAARRAMATEQIVQAVRNFIERYGDSHRFSDVDTFKFSESVQPWYRAGFRQAGWWKAVPNGGRVYLFTAEGMREALKGYDFSRALAVLRAAGALPPPGIDGKSSKLLRLDGHQMRVYEVDPRHLATAAFDPLQQGAKIDAETLTITKSQLRSVMLRWEQDYRDGKTISYGEMNSMPVERVVDESTKYMWDMLEAHTEKSAEIHSPQSERKRCIALLESKIENGNSRAEMMAAWALIRDSFWELD